MQQQNCRSCREDCLRLLKHSARLTYEYLSRPQHFLSKYLYAESYELKAEMICSALELFVEYAYLPEVMRQYLAKKIGLTLGRALREIDCRY